MLPKLNLTVPTNASLQILEAGEDYPIRTIEHIQPHSFLLVVHWPTLEVVQLSTNAEAMVPGSLLGQSLGTLLTAAAIEQLQNGLESAEKTSQRLTIKGLNQSVWVHSHCQDDLVVLELEPEVPESSDVERLQQQIIEATVRFERADGLVNFAQTLTEVIGELLQFDRVMVYRFLPDHSGVVIAETKHSDVEAYGGLHFPATDIPAEARALFCECPLRWIPDINYRPAALVPVINPITSAPLDLGQTWLRGVSSCHGAYLKNMAAASQLDDHSPGE